MPNLTEPTTSFSRPSATWGTSFLLNLKRTTQVGRPFPSQWISSRAKFQPTDGESIFFRPLTTAIPVSFRISGTKKMPLSITPLGWDSKPSNLPKPQLLGMELMRVEDFHFLYPLILGPRSQLMSTVILKPTSPSSMSRCIPTATVKGWLKTSTLILRLKKWTSKISEFK